MQIIMMIISSREFRDHQKKYFDLVDQDEQIIVQRGKDKAYVIVPLNDVDRLSVNDELIQTVKDAEVEYRKNKTTQIKDPGDIWESIL
jgi:prevent-host-death family protein